MLLQDRSIVHVTIKATLEGLFSLTRNTGHGLYNRIQDCSEHSKCRPGYKNGLTDQVQVLKIDFTLTLA